MRVPNIMKLVTIGFAAALFFAGAARAQEISNTEWPDGQNVVTPGHTASTDIASAAQDTKAANAAATANAPAVRQEASTAQQTPSDATAAFLAISLALATLYVVAGTKRANQNRYARADEAVRSVSLS